MPITFSNPFFRGQVHFKKNNNNETVEETEGTMFRIKVNIMSVYPHWHLTIYSRHAESAAPAVH